MKKNLFILSLISVFMLNLCAQNTITNGGFETWSYGNPVGWTPKLYGTITSIIDIPMSVNFGTQSNDSHSGNYAIKLASADFTIPGLNYTVTFPGMLQLGESEGFSIPLSDVYSLINFLQDTTGTSGFTPDSLAFLGSLMKVLSNGAPCATTPASISMWAKYTPLGDDNFVVVSLTKKDGQIVDYAYGAFQCDNPQQYQQIFVNFEKAGEPCDSIMLMVFASMKLNSGSILLVDDVEIHEPVGIPQNEFQDFSVFPNPVSDVLTISAEGEFFWSLCDISGKQLMNGAGNGTQKIDVSALASGLYMVNVKSGNKSATRKITLF